jgi:CRISPR/Cas system CSM-associated protein Csm2 small subunit
MSDLKQEQQQQTGIRGTSAKTVVVKVNPLELSDNHGFSRLVKQPLSKINLLEELKDNDVVNNINRLKQLQSAIVAALLEDIQQEIRYITIPSLIVVLLKNSLRNVIRNMIVILDAVYSQVINKISKDIDDTEKLLEDLKLIKDLIDLLNSFLLAVDNISIEVANLLNMNLPADRAPRLVNQILTGYDLWKQQ